MRFDLPRTACIALLLSGAAVAQTPIPIENFGFYTDRPSYAPDDVIQIRGNWADGTVVRYVLRHVGTGGTFPLPTGWTPVATPLAQSADTMHTNVLPNYGSFVDFKQPAGAQPTLANRNRFTVEGWIMPTITTSSMVEGEDEIVIAGQLEAGSTTSGCSVAVDGTAGLGITKNGELFAAVNVPAGMRCVVTDSAIVVDPDALAWYHVAMTYNNNRIRLYVDGQLEKTSPAISGKAVAMGLPFLLGARYEGDPGSHDSRSPRGPLRRPPGRLPGVEGRTPAPTDPGHLRDGRTWRDR